MLDLREWVFEEDVGIEPITFALHYFKHMAAVIESNNPAAIDDYLGTIKSYG